MLRLIVLAACMAFVVTPAFAQKVLRVIPHADLTLLDPVFAPIVITREYGLMVYEELFAWDSKLSPKPQMVDTWSTSPDGLTWRFTLRNGLKFHDGQVVTTADVIPSLKRWMDRDPIGAKVAAATEALAAVDAKTFEIKLKTPYPGMLFALGSAVGQIPVIMRAKDLEGDPGARITTAIGSGPYRFNAAARVSGALTVFDRNTDYVPRKEPADGLAGGRLAKIERVEWRVVPDAATASVALQRGEVDIWEAPSLDLVPDLAKRGGVKLLRITEFSSQVMLRPNSLYPPFNDPRARLALAYIINQGDELAAGFGDPRNWKRCNAYFICGGPYGTEVGTEDFKPDFDKAKALLTAAGYKGEKLVFIATQEIGWIGRLSEVAAAAMQKAGMNIDLQYADWGTTAGRQSVQTDPKAGGGGWNLLITGASGPTMHHPLTNIGTNTSCERKNFAGWPCDLESEKLRQAFLDANDAERPAALEKLHRRLALMEPYRVLGQFDQPVALRSNVNGLLSSPVIVYWNIDKH